MLESLGMLLVGLGLFVNGSNILSSNLKSLTSRRFRLTLTRKALESRDNWHHLKRRLAELFRYHFYSGRTR